MTTIAVLFKNYGPYHFARLEQFHQVCNQVGWKAIGVELARAELTYEWKADSKSIICEFISIIDDQVMEEVPVIKLTQALYRTLGNINPDVLVIAGYSPMIMLSAMIWCRLNRKPAILMTASKEDDAERTLWKETTKSLILRFYQAALVGGSPQKRYFEKLGMPSDRIFIGYDVVDNESFAKSKIQHLENPIKNPFFFTINRFIEKKNLLWLLSVYSEYRNQLGEKAWDLVLCGDGDLRIKILNRIAELNLEKFVHCPGFLQRNEQLPYFAHAKCFIHSSTQEQWGLVVNEAMAASLPVLLSNRCGCFEDLLIEGENGFGFDPENAPQLLHLMLNVSCNTSDLTRLGDNARSHIEKFSPLLFGNNLVKAIHLSM